MIDIPETRGGSSGTLNMLLQWYFETPASLSWWYIGVLCGGTSGYL